MKKASFISAILLFSLISGNALAGRYWYHSKVTNVNGNPLGEGNTAIGMRSNDTYPVIASNESAAAMLPGFWVNGPVGFYENQLIDADTSSDGQVMFAGTEGQAATFGPSGWGVSSYPGQAEFKASAAFDNDGNPAVLHQNYQGDVTLSMKHGSSWYSSEVGNEQIHNISTPAYALDFDSLNQANVVFEDGGGMIYGVRGSSTGNQWQFSQPVSSINPEGLIDMAMTENDVPYIFYPQGGFLKYAVYSRQTGDWSTNMLDMLFGQTFCAVADNQGGIGVAYISDNGRTLSFVSTDGDGSWSGPDRLSCPEGIRYDRGLGLTFDGDNNPVISYADGGGETWIAYDPVVPEPATIGLLAAGGLFIARRRK